MQRSHQATTHDDLVTTFETLHALCQSLPKATDDSHRFVEWVGSAAKIGLARRDTGAIEVFIKGERLSSKSDLVGRHLRHDDWTSHLGTQFRANRIVFPAEEHFIAVAAFVTEELLRYGADVATQEAFDVAEPVVEMALRGTAMVEDEQLGLFGELYLLRELLRKGTTTAKQARCIESWRGYEQSSRDFVFQGDVEVEVKTTRRADSTHPVSRLAQIDPHVTGAGIPTEQLYLVSVGVSVDDAQGETLPSLVESILTTLGVAGTPGRRNAIQNLFLNLVGRYGGGRGYDHDQMRDSPAYSSRWAMRWIRTYDMNQGSIRVLRRQDLASLSHIDPESVRLTVKLPSEVVGRKNPTNGVAELVDRLMA